jgi:acyl-ACP thioesterase
VRLDTIARWVQDVAWADVEDAGLRGLTVWFVRRTRIRVRRFPRIDEGYRLTTYVTGVGRMWAERRTDIAAPDGGPPDVEVACIWVHIDPERRLPSPIHAVELETWTGDSTREVKARLRHPPRPDADATGRDWTFRASELDVAEHINNTAYFTPLDDELLGPDGARPEPSAIDLEIEYRAPALAGAKRLLAAGPMRWLVDGATGEVHASARLVQWPS